MGGRATAVLAAALTVATLVWWFDRLSDEVQPAATVASPRADPQDFPRLLSFDPAAVTAIHLQRGDHDVRAERRGDTWSVGAPTAALDDFLQNLQGLAELDAMDATVAELKDYGLDPPAGMIELTRRDAAPIVIRFGAHNPPGTGTYVQLDRRERVVLTGALILWEFDKALRALTAG